MRKSILVFTFLVSAMLVVATSRGGVAQMELEPPAVVYPSGSSRMDHLNFIMTLEPGPYVIVATSYQLHNADEYTLWVKSMR